VCERLAQGCYLKKQRPGVQVQRPNHASAGVEINNLKIRHLPIGANCRSGRSESFTSLKFDFLGSAFISGCEMRNLYANLVKKYGLKLRLLAGQLQAQTLDYNYCILYFATCKWPMALCCLINWLIDWILHYFDFVEDLPSVLWHCWLAVRKSIRKVKIQRRCWCGNLSEARSRLFAYGPAYSTASQVPIVSWLILIQTGFTFLVLAYPGCPGKQVVKRV